MTLVADLTAAGADALADAQGRPIAVTAVDEVPALPAGTLAGVRTALGGTAYVVAGDDVDAAAAFAAGAAPVVAAALGVPAATAVAQPAPAVTAGPGAQAYLCTLAAGDAELEMIVVLEPELVAAVTGGPQVAPAEFPVLGGGAAPGQGRDLSVLADVAMSVTVELGRARMKVRDLLSLTTGSVVELDRAAGAAVDVLVNGTVVARGDVVVIDDELGVRITDVVDRA